MSRSILSPVMTFNGCNGLYQDHIFDLEGDGGRGRRGADIINPLIKWFICARRLRDVFEIPSGVDKIQFRAYSEPGRGRTKMKFTVSKDCFGSTDKTVSIDGHGNETMVDDTFDPINTLAKGRKTWYVNVYYWE